MVIGTVAATATIVSSLYSVAQLRYAAALLPFSEGLAINAYNMPSPVNPYGVMSLGLTGAWFLVTSLLMLRHDFPRLPAYVGIVTFADLTMGFLASLALMSDLAFFAALIAGAFGGPIFWLWLGILLVRYSRTRTQRVGQTAPARS